MQQGTVTGSIKSNVKHLKDIVMSQFTVMNKQLSREKKTSCENTDMLGLQQDQLNLGFLLQIKIVLTKSN